MGRSGSLRAAPDDDETLDHAAPPMPLTASNTFWPSDRRHGMSRRAGKYKTFSTFRAKIVRAEAWSGSPPHQRRPPGEAGPEAAEQSELARLYQLAIHCRPESNRNRGGDRIADHFKVPEHFGRIGIELLGERVEHHAAGLMEYDPIDGVQA